MSTITNDALRLGDFVAVRRHDEVRCTFVVAIRKGIAYVSIDQWGINEDVPLGTTSKKGMHNNSVDQFGWDPNASPGRLAEFSWCRLQVFRGEAVQ